MGLGLLVLGAGAVAQLTALAVPWRYREMFERAAKDQGEDADLLHAIAWHESNLNPSAISLPNRNGSKDWGLMQINDVNLAPLGLNQQTALLPEASANAAAKLIKSIRPRARNMLDVISIYNAGERPGGGPKLVDGLYVNQSYVRSVAARYQLVKLARFAPLKREG